MFELTNEASLLATFRYIDRRRVEVTRDVTLPVFVNDYLTWPFGKRVYLVAIAIRLGGERAEAALRRYIEPIGWAALGLLAAAIVYLVIRAHGA